jgi:rhamnogalacturonan endolyase
MPIMKKKRLLTVLFACLFAHAFANKNIPAANVTITDNGTTVILNNGIIAATITKSTAAVETLTYNGYDMLSGGYNGGQVYWSWNMPNYQNPSGCSYSLTANPANNNGDYAEIKLHMTWNGSSSTAAMDVDVYYSLLRGVSGLYASATLSHPASYPANPGGEWRMASYVGSTFDWLSVDSLRNRKMASYSDWTSASVVTGAPKEVELLTTGIYKNQYECKYDYSADFGDIDVWGWSSTAKNLGIWVTAPSKEYYNGGPMKRELMCHNSPTMLNMLGGTHYGMGGDMDVASGETWKKTYGPFLIYCNSVPSGTANAPMALWADAKAQAKIEQAAWPYSWFTNTDYIKEAGRGTVTGRLVISDATITNVSAANMWVGLAIPPQSTTGITDFQMWNKNYQFWVKTDDNGNFSIPHVLPGTYNMYAFGANAAGQMTKNNYANVAAGTTTALGDVVWIPTRTAPTIWEIGIPDRSAKEFKHGTDWWTSNIYPNTHWAKFMDYPDEFPNDVNFTIGQSDIATDWNFVQNYDNTVQVAAPNWQVNFNLTTAPTIGSTAAIYTAFAAAYNAALIVKVNGTLITSSTGTYPPNQSDAKIRKGIHGAFGDLRFTFAASLLKAGTNTISFTIRNTGGATVGDIMYDYVRLEASGTSLVTSTLPVALQPLTVAKQANTAALSWATTTELNNDYFAVQKSIDGNVFYNIGKVLSKGNSSMKIDYNFIDVQPFNGMNYYRLKQVDKDGKIAYSNVVNADFAFSNAMLQISPNPVSSKLALNYFAAQPSTLAFDIIDTNGKTIKSFSANAVKGKNNFQLDVSSLQAGFHLVKLFDGTKIVAEKFLKQ